MIYVIDFIRGFLEGFLKTMPKWTTPFVKEVQSNLILFGYDPRKGTFFEESYEEAEEAEEAYDAALDRWRAIIPKETPERDLLESDW